MVLFDDVTSAPSWDGDFISHDNFSAQVMRTVIRFCKMKKIRGGGGGGWLHFNSVVCLRCILFLA